jgi:hypothetical protein
MMEKKEYCEFKVYISQEKIDKYRGKICPFSKPGWYGCVDRASGYARSRKLCRSHMQYLAHDNKKRINRGIEIPDNLDVIREEKCQVHLCSRFLE